MREIKFRLWNPCRKGYHYDVDTVMDCLKQQISGLYDHKKEYGGVFEQYTGLKDKNGTEIYEGDVVRCWGGASAFGYHEFEANILIDEFYQLRVSDIGYYDEFYILGNIHENPELLEGTK